MTRHDTLAEMIATVRHDLDAIEDSISLADPEVERDIRLLSEVADHSACHMRMLQHAHTRSLLEEV
jgi:hypothetical protein